MSRKFDVNVRVKIINKNKPKLHGKFGRISCAQDNLYEVILEKPELENRVLVLGDNLIMASPIDWRRGFTPDSHEITLTIGELRGYTDRIAELEDQLKQIRSIVN